MKKFLIAFGSLALPLGALAHAGDHQQTVWYHFLGNPFHALPLAGLLMAMVYFAVKKIYSKK